MKAGNLVRWSVLAVMLVAITAVFVTQKPVDGITLEDFVSAGGAQRPALFIVGYAVATVLFLPGSVMTLADGALFGPLAGALYSLTGATFGATLAFLTARFVAGDWVARKAGIRLQHFVQGVEKEGWRFVALVRLVPLIPFNLLNYVLRLKRIPLAAYVVASLICMLPGAVAYAYLGYAGREAALGGEWIAQQALIALALVAVVLFLPRLVMRLRRPPIGRTDAAVVRQLMTKDRAPVIIDVRGADEYRGELGHIAGSMHIPLAELKAALPRLEPMRDADVVLVCKTDRRSAKAAERLASEGFRAVNVMNDGMESWSRRGFPVSR